MARGMEARASVWSTAGRVGVLGYDETTGQ